MASLKFGVDFYDNIFDDSRDFQTYVDTTIADLYNTSEWKKWFPRNTMPDESNAFPVEEAIKMASPAPDVRARYSEFSQSDKDGFEKRVITIPDLGHGIDRMTLQDKEKFEKLASTMNVNQILIEQFTERVNEHMKAAMGALTYMSRQLITTGEIHYSLGQGLSYDVDYGIPTSNRYTATSAAWTDPENSTPLMDMHIAEDDFRTRTNYQGPLYWRMNKATARLFCENPDVISKVGNFMLSTGVFVNQEIGISIEQYNKWASSTNKWISPIVVVEDSYVVDQTFEGRTFGNDGWAEGKIVLTPAGFDGKLRWCSPTEILIKRGLPNYSIATLEGGMIAIENVYKDSMVPEWNTNYALTAAPVLERWNRHCILDTLTV